MVADEGLLRELVVKMLRELGYLPVVPEGAQGALELIRAGQEPIDLVVSDVVMPGLSGPALRAAAREVRPDLPFLFISGYAAGFSDAHDFLPQGAHLLTKPFTKRDLAQEIYAALTRVPRGA